VTHLSGGEPRPKEVYRYELDVIVVADSRDEADRAISIRGPHLLRSVRWSVIRDKHGTSPAWRVTDGKGEIDVRPKRQRKRDAMP
jgi:hypothetical protein